jgi:chromosome condensin MukBEF MukE localization factor
MGKLKVKLTSATDLSQALDNFRNACMRSCSSDAEQKTLCEKVASEVNDLARRGRELSAIGSQFQVKRIVESESCQVVIDVHFGPQQPSLVSKLRSLFSRG